MIVLRGIIKPLPCGNVGDCLWGSFCGGTWRGLEERLDLGVNCRGFVCYHVSLVGRASIKIKRIKMCDPEHIKCNKHKQNELIEITKCLVVGF